MYLLVLSVNAIIAVQRGVDASAGEVPLWGTLFVATTAATILLIASFRDARMLVGVQ